MISTHVLNRTGVVWLFMLTWLGTTNVGAVDPELNQSDRELITKIANDHHLQDIHDIVLSEPHRVAVHASSSSIRTVYVREKPIRANERLCKYRAMKMINDGGRGWSSGDVPLFARLVEPNEPCPDAGYTIVKGVDDGTLVWLFDALAHYEFTGDQIGWICEPKASCHLALGSISEVSVSDDLGYHETLSSYLVRYDIPRANFTLSVYFTRALSGQGLELRDFKQTVY